MGVPKSKRSESKMEFYHNSLKLRKNIIDLLLRDFGVKQKQMNIDILKNKFGMSESDRQMFEYVVKKYGIESEFDYEFPRWYIERLRNKILNALDKMTDNIIVANSCYPVTQLEKDTKRKTQTDAIGLCYVIIDGLTEAIQNLPVDANKYTRFIEMLQEEIRVLKGWRKYTYKIPIPTEKCVTSDKSQD